MLNNSELHEGYELVVNYEAHPGQDTARSRWNHWAEFNGKDLLKMIFRLQETVKELEDELHRMEK